MDDPITAESVARMASEDEEVDAEALAVICTVSPLTMLSRTALAAGTTGPVACDVLVVGRGATALALLAECLPDRSMVGSLAWADTNFKGESAIASRVHKSAFCFSTAPSDGAARTAILPCALECAPQQCTALARSILGLVHAQLTIVLAELPAHAHHGPEDSSQEEVLALLQTDAARQACGAAPVPVPYLCAGNLVAELPAAMLSCAQARHAKAAAIVRIHSSPHVTREGLQGMGKSLVAMLAAHGASQAIKQLDISGAVTRACSNVAEQQGSRVYL